MAKQWSCLWLYLYKEFKVHLAIYRDQFYCLCFIVKEMGVIKKWWEIISNTNNNNIKMHENKILCILSGKNCVCLQL